MIGPNCGSGWYDIIDELLDKLKKIDPDIVILQIKEKFGILRVYVRTSKIPEVDKAINMAQNRSESTCERCGKHGITRQVGDWTRTLCTACTRLVIEGNQYWTED